MRFYLRALFWVFMMSWLAAGALMYYVASGQVLMAAVTGLVSVIVFTRMIYFSNFLADWRTRRVSALNLEQRYGPSFAKVV